jgi:hypothetical protein
MKEESGMGDTPLTDTLDLTRVEFGIGRSPAYGDAIRLCKTLERKNMELLSMNNALADIAVNQSLDGMTPWKKDEIIELARNKALSGETSGV